MLTVFNEQKCKWRGHADSAPIKAISSQPGCGGVYFACVRLHWWLELPCMCMEHGDGIMACKALHGTRADRAECRFWLAVCSCTLW